MLFNRVTAIACCLLISVAAVCQGKNKDVAKVKFGDVKPEDFKPEYYPIDSSADAVFLYEAGSTSYEGNNTGWFSVVYKEHKRIRLLHKKSFDDVATIKIYLLTDIKVEQKVSDLQAATYNIESGKINIIKIDKNSVFKDKQANYQVMKFTFPDLKEGSIIEYSYTLTTPVTNVREFIPTWEFQSDYPKLWSEYTTEIPQFFDFVVMSQGYLNPEIDTVILSSANFNRLMPGGVNASYTSSFRSNTVKHTWAYKNVPSLKEENYITDLSNYTQKLEFQYSAFRPPEGVPQFFMHTWFETVEQLMKYEKFGLEITKENGWLKDDVRSALSGETNAMEKAKKIYEYVRDNYTCTDYSAMYLSQTLKKTQQLKRGNVADINMLLVAMLRVADYDASPILLSTRDHGKTFDTYPILEKFNYLIASLKIDDKQYFLDAADPLLGFGHLGEDCYNGNARLIAPMPTLFNFSADSLHEAEVTSLFLSNDEKGRITGTYKHIMGEMGSNRMREKMKKSNTGEYFQDVKKSYGFDVNIENGVIDSLKQPEMPVSVQYDLSFKPEEDILYFTPVFGDAAHKENPFKAAERFYPVEMPYCTDETFILNMEVPKGYEIDELPKPARVKLNETEGMFEYLIQAAGDRIQLRCRIKLNKANFEPDDYETLRNFFAFIVQKQGEQIVFKKQ